MLERGEIESVCEIVLAASGSDQTEVMVSSGQEALTRYANNTIHQNVWESDVGVSIRAVQGQRLGVCSTNDLRPDSLRHAARQATRLASLAPENPAFPGLSASPPPPPGPEPAAATIQSTPEQRGDTVGPVLDLAAAQDLNGSGALETSYLHLAVANSEGTFAYGRHTRAQMSVVMQTEDSSGRAEAHTTDAGTLDAPALAHTAAEKALNSRQPRALQPGPYTVILEPLAVADMLFWLGLYGFNALTYQEKRSFLCEKLGQRLGDERLNLYDDGLDPRGLPLTFDFEGVPKRRVQLIENGVAVGMVHDLRTAAAADPPTDSTGHALPAPNPWGPAPTNMFLEPGKVSLEEMIASTERGLLVTRFHYTNMVHPVQTILTGMTRDGTFLIEEGSIVGGVKNLRFTQSLLEALDNVLEIGDTGVQCEYVWTPALKVADFSFSGVTEF